jgi:hypothetical protein
MSRLKRYALVAIAVVAVLVFTLVWLASHGESGSYQLYDADGRPLEHPRRLD